MPKSLVLLNNDYMWTLFITQESIIRNFKLVFEMHNEVFATRFYNYLSKGFKMKKIYIDDYFIRLYGLVQGGFIEKN